MWSYQNKPARRRDASGGLLLNMGREYWRSRLPMCERMARGQFEEIPAIHHLDQLAHHPSIVCIETGKYDPSLPLAFQIARCFNMPIEAIFFPDELQDPDTP